DAGGRVRAVEPVARRRELDPVLAERVVGAGRDDADDRLAALAHLLLDRRRDAPHRILAPPDDAVPAGWRLPVGAPDADREARLEASVLEPVERPDRDVDHDAV